MFNFYNFYKNNICLYLLCGFILTSASLCRSDSVFSNEPVPLFSTPQPSTGCPNVPVIPSAVNLTASHVTASTTPQIFVCGNQIESQTIINCTNSISQTNVVQSNSSVRPGCTCSFPVSQCCMQLFCQGCCSIGSDITTSAPAFTTSAPPPEAPIKCPSGTINVGRRCHLLYCPQGSEMINDKCVVIECPGGTVWTGDSCSLPGPNVQNIKFQSNILTQFNQTKPQIVLNNTNNIVVNASLNLNIDIYNKNYCSYENSDCKEATIKTSPLSNLNCCEVMTPRICKQYKNRWHCYSRRSRRCGEFCIAPIIYLKPSRIHATRQYLVIPPIQNDCQSYGNCGQQMGGYDCSGCAFNDMEHCSYYCYRYACPSRKCDFYEQQKYCADITSLYGCKEEDGCFDSWCI